MKRTIAMVLVLILAFSSVAFAADNTDISRAEAVEKIMRRIYSEGREAPLVLKDAYTVHSSGYFHYIGDVTDMRPVLSEINANVSTSSFKDITANNPNATAIALAKAMGIVNGWSSDLFHPEDSLTYNAAIKMLICGLGYGNDINSATGYPKEYIAAADKLGITKDVSFKGEDKISAEKFDALLEKSFGLDGYPMRNVMMYITLPGSAEKCVDMYAKAVQDRRGAIQYVLFDKELREQKLEGFKAMMWTTGTSSPWVSGYEVAKKDDSSYEVTLHYATSAGAAEDVKETVSVAKNGERYEITGIK